MAAGDFKLIWASGDTTVGPDHADFKLSAGGEEVGLFKENGSALDTIDFIIYTAQTTDVSFRRQTDAASTWVFFNTATPDASNGTLSLEEERSMVLPRLCPNPFAQRLAAENPYASVMELSMYDIQDRLMLTEQIEPYQSTTLEDLGTAGLCVLHFEAGGSRGTVRLIKR